ncbi:hypothetical protein [Paenibacillus silvisoli]|uniref:hypothetical protein n=1 Tax=Paenibacillus silvisoli TaxID=3110539 RepID=UPI002805D23E|nr:hypothetical protein [Paenibacillus silvisoli]
MTIQFLDSRISIHSNDFGGSTPVTDLPLMVGDIGLQVVAANPLNTSNVRVSLSGTVFVDFAPPPTGEPTVPVSQTIAISVERGGDGGAGTGVQILNQQFFIVPGHPLYPISVTAADFPPAADVLTGQIRYVMYVATDGGVDLVLAGPAVFNGLAAAGTT